MRKFNFPSHLDIGVPRGPEQVGDAGPAHRSGHGLASGLTREQRTSDKHQQQCHCHYSAEAEVK